MSDFFLGYITGIGALFYIWSVGYAVRFFIERGFRVSFGMIIIVLIMQMIMSIKLIWDDNKMSFFF